MPVQYVTLVNRGGTPVRLADANGAPFPTTGSPGSLVFSNGPTLDNPTLVNAVYAGGIGFGNGTVSAPAVFFGTSDRGFYSAGTTNISAVAQDTILWSATLPGDFSVTRDVLAGRDVSVARNALFAGSTSGTITLQAQAIASGTLTLPAGGGTLATTAGGVGEIRIGTTTVTNGTSGRVLYDNGGIAGEYAITGTGSAVLNSGPTLIAPILGTPASGTLTFCTGLPISTGVAGLGTGVATALAVAVGNAGAFVTFNGALGTPSSGTLTNCTGLPVANLSGLGTGVATALAVAVGNAGAFVTFNGALGTPSSGALTNCTGLPRTSITGLGTGVATALGVNVGTAGAFVAQNGALGTPSSGTLTNCTGFPTATAAQTFLTGANVALAAGSPANVVNTGSIGANGQTWLIMATMVGFSASGATVLTADIFNGTATLAAGEAVSPASNQSESITLTAIATLSGATTFTLRGWGSAANSAAQRATVSGASTTDKMTNIVAVRLA
jgi:hypothetical protein